MRSRDREQHRRTILSLLETKPATAARPFSPEVPPEGVAELDFDWRPQPLARAVDSDRTFRWPIVLLFLLIGVSAALAIRLFIAVPTNLVAEHLASYRETVESFEEALAALSATAERGEAGAVAEFSAAAAEFRRVAEAPLPSGGLIGQRGTADLETAQRHLLAMADSADSLLARLHTASTYRGLGQQLGPVPALPTHAPPELIDPAARALADFEVAVSTAAQRFDDHPEYEAFRRRVADTIEALPGWIDSYLLALRREEADTAAALLVELQARMDLIAAELDQALTQVEEEAAVALGALLSAAADAKELVGEEG